MSEGALIDGVRRDGGDEPIGIRKRFEAGLAVAGCAGVVLLSPLSGALLAMLGG